MISRDDVVKSLSEYLKGSVITQAEFEDAEDAPFSIIQVKRVLGSWDRAMALATADYENTAVEVAQTKEDKTVITKDKPVIVAK